MKTIKNIDIIIDHIIDGLCTDGGHHKQYYLEKILEELVGPEAMQELKEENEWEEGIPA